MGQLLKIKQSLQAGYVALISSIIISLMLLGLAAVLASGGFFGRFNAVSAENKRVALGLAESCVNEALLRLAGNYNYTVFDGPNYEADKGARVDLESGQRCYIDDISPADLLEDNKRVIKTFAGFNETFSNLEILATIPDPTVPPAIPPPACSLAIEPTTINSGSSAWLSWSTSNANSISVDQGIGSLVPVSSGSVSVSPTVSTTYSATANGPSGPGSCSASVSVLPAPNCADTLLMLDRTGSMTSADLANERQAAKAFLDLYNNVTPIPQAAVGRFGDDSTGSPEAEVQVGGQLSSNYGDDDAANDNDLYSAIDQATNFNSPGLTSLKDAVNAGSSELNSARHDPDKAKALILISDGQPNDPPDVNTDSGFKFPASFENVANDWDVNDVNNVLTSDDVYAQDDDGQTQVYDFFSFGVPSAAVIKGIEVKVEAKSTDDSGCRLGVRFGQDDGSNLSTEKPAVLTNAEQIFSLGGPTDTWGRTWTPTDITNINFDLILRDADPGASCDNAAVTSVDQLQTKVYYSIPGNAPEVSLNAADSAKQTGVQIFTIHFGSDPSGLPGQELLAQMASGSVSYAGHENGSADDQGNATAENTDNDQFFISPTSADMPGIFQTIGAIVCPAAAAPPAPPGEPPPLPPPPPAPNITIDSWQEIP